MEIVWPLTLSEIVMPKLGTDKIRRTSEPPEGPAGDPSPPQPKNDADTTTTLMFKIIQNDRQIDTASALSVVNFIVVVVVIGIYLRVVRPMRED